MTGDHLVLTGDHLLVLTGDHHLVLTGDHLLVLTGDHLLVLTVPTNAITYYGNGWMSINSNGQNSESTAHGYHGG